MMLTSALLALNLSYWIWYTGLKRLGGSRTSVYSYLTPVVAMIVAAIWLGEPISANQIAGAGGHFRRAAHHATFQRGSASLGASPHPFVTAEARRRPTRAKVGPYCPPFRPTRPL